MTAFNLEGLKHPDFVLLKVKKKYFKKVYKIKRKKYAIFYRYYRNYVCMVYEGFNKLYLCPTGYVRVCVNLCLFTNIEWNLIITLIIYRGILNYTVAVRFVYVPSHAPRYMCTYVPWYCHIIDGTADWGVYAITGNNFEILITMKVTIGTIPGTILTKLMIELEVPIEFTIDEIFI